MCIVDLRKQHQSKFPKLNRWGKKKHSLLCSIGENDRRICEMSTRRSRWDTFHFGLNNAKPCDAFPCLFWRSRRTSWWSLMGNKTIDRGEMQKMLEARCSFDRPSYILFMVVVSLTVPPSGNRRWRGLWINQQNATLFNGSFWAWVSKQRPETAPTNPRKTINHSHWSELLSSPSCLCCTKWLYDSSEMYQSHKVDAETLGSLLAALVIAF